MIEPAWQITLLYVAIFGTLIGGMKCVSVALSPRSVRSRWKFLLFAPVYSVETWRRVRPVSRAAISRLLWKWSWVLPCVLASYTILRIWIAPRVDSWHLRAWLALLPLYWLVEALGLGGQMWGLPAGKVMPPFFDGPLRSKGLFEFWGRRWNLWMTDWLNEACFQPLGRRKWLGTLAAFFVSGLIHELIVNLPLYLVYTVNLFGTMMAYFLLQVAGMAVERRWLRRRPRTRRLVLWVFVAAPAPLVVNEGTQRIFHLFG